MRVPRVLELLENVRLFTVQFVPGSCPNRNGPSLFARISTVPPVRLTIPTPCMPRKRMPGSTVMVTDPDPERVAFAFTRRSPLTAAVPTFIVGLYVVVLTV